MTNWWLWMLAGIVSLVGGFVALANPLAATLTADLLAGYMFIVVGILTVFSAFSDQGWGGRILSILLGIALVFLGINLVAQPFAGAMSLTFMAGVVILAMGIVRIILGFGARSGRLRGVMLLSGAISLLLGIMIFANWPQSAVVVLGVFLAVELISNGVSLIVLSLARKSGEEI